MGKYKAIAVIYGSDSSEWEVSCRSGEFVASRIDGTEYDIYQIFARFGKWSLVAYKKQNSMRVSLPEGSRPTIDKTDFSVKILGEKVNFDYAYIVQHGTPGENGLIQGYFELMGIPFSTCSAFACTIAFDKYSCKSYLKDSGAVKLAPDAFIRKGEDLDAFCAKVNSTLKYPVFVKPTQAGSSFGLSMVKTPGELPAAVSFAFSESPSVLVEQGVNGRELTCATYFDGTGVKTLPLIEIVSDNEFFDYDAKYNGHSKEICPAPVDEAVNKLVSETSASIYKCLGCKGLVRMDYIYTGEELYFLEVNIIPGMTSASLVPKMVRTAGMDMTEFLNIIIENS